jgi:hypothetical protein
VVSTLPTRAKRGGHRKEDRRLAVEYILWRMGMMHTPSCLCFNATLLGLVRCRDRQTVRRNNWFGRRECGVQRVPSPRSVHPICDIIDGIVLPPRPPYWQAAMEVSELTRANNKANRMKH